MKHILLFISIIGTLQVSAQNLFFLSLDTGYQETLYQLDQYREITWLNQQPEQQLRLLHGNMEVRYDFEQGKISSIELHKRYTKKKYFKKALKDSRRFFKTLKLEEERLVKQKNYRQYQYTHPHKRYRLISSQDKEKKVYLITLYLSKQMAAPIMVDTLPTKETVRTLDVYHR